MCTKIGRRHWGYHKQTYHGSFSTAFLLAKTTSDMSMTTCPNACHNRHVNATKLSLVATSCPLKIPACHIIDFFFIIAWSSSASSSPWNFYVRQRRRCIFLLFVCFSRHWLYFFFDMSVRFFFWWLLIRLKSMSSIIISN